MQHKHKDKKHEMQKKKMPRSFDLPFLKRTWRKKTVENWVMKNDLDGTFLFCSKRIKWVFFHCFLHFLNNKKKSVL